MMNPYEMIKACEAAEGSNAKKAILSQCAQQENVHEVRYVLKTALDPFVTFGVKKFKMGEMCEHGGDFSINWDNAKTLLNNLQSRRLTGTEALEEIRKVSGGLDSQQQHVFSRILKKDLRCGLGVKTVNAVFPGLVREFSVQLAQREDSGKIDFPCLVEAKLDGIRCLAFAVEGKVSYYSRNGLEFENFGAFSDDLLKLANGKNVVFDGEVIGASLEDSFRGVTKQARRKNVEQDNLMALKYYLFDMLSYNEFLKQKCSIKQVDRSTKLIENFNEFLPGTDVSCVKPVLGRIAKDEASLNRFYEKCVATGYEGVIVKNINAMYLYKRDACWTKIKPKESADLEIVGIEEGEGKYKKMLGAFVVDYDGVNVRVGTGFIDEQRKNYFTKKMIGRIVEVVYDCETPDKSLRFPRFKSLRPDLD